MAAETERGGGCLCGAVRYRVVGEPTSTNICHCEQCRRQSGAPYAAFVSYPGDRFALLSGEPATFRSSEKAVRQFCPRCGSTLFWRGDGSSDVDIFLGTLDDPAAMPAPKYQLWTAHRLPWAAEVEGIPAYPRGRDAPPSFQ